MYKFFLYKIASSVHHIIDTLVQALVVLLVCSLHLTLREINLTYYFDEKVYQCSRIFSLLDLCI